MRFWNNLSLTKQILLALAAGALFGIIINLSAQSGLESTLLNVYLIEGFFNVVGSIFINALKMMVVPLIFVSLIVGVTKLGDVNKLGKIGAKTIALYLLTTAIAITIAISLAVVFAPGTSGTADPATAEAFQSVEAEPLSQVFINMVPSNPIQAMAEAKMLQLIFFSILFGIALALAGERAKSVMNFFHELDAVILKMVLVIMKLAPYGVFCLISRTFATEGFDEIKNLSEYFFVVILGLIVHATVTYPLLLKYLGGLNPLTFVSKMRAVWTFAFSTSSSNATIPVTLDTVENRLGVKNSVASFTVPLGATINMDGTAIMQGVATVYIANLHGVDLGLAQYLVIILTATLASIGSAGVPSAGIIMLTVVLTQLGLPTDDLVKILAIDRLLDMLRTVVNISGDATVSCLVAKSEKSLDQTVFDDPDAGTVIPAETQLPHTQAE